MPLNDALFVSRSTSMNASTCFAHLSIASYLTFTFSSFKFILFALKHNVVASGNFSFVEYTPVHKCTCLIPHALHWTSFSTTISVTLPHVFASSLLFMACARKCSPHARERNWVAARPQPNSSLSSLPVPIHRRRTRHPSSSLLVNNARYEHTPFWTTVQAVYEANMLYTPLVVLSVLSLTHLRISKMWPENSALGAPKV